MKLCRRCGETKPLEAFYRDRYAKDGRSAYCAECNKRKVREWADANPDRSRATAERFRHRNRTVLNTRARERRQADPAAHRDAKLRYRYGLGLEEFGQLSEAQNHACAICGNVVLLHVDHDHASGAVRGLLCAPCNQGIGLLRDDPERLQAAIDYLTRTWAPT